MCGGPGTVHLYAGSQMALYEIDFIERKPLGVRSEGQGSLMADHLHGAALLREAELRIWGSGVVE